MVNESNLQEYVKKAEDMLNTDPDNLIVVTAKTDIGFAYVFYFNSKKYLETKNFLDALTGNSPIVVTKVDGKFHQTGTAVADLEYYLKPIKEKYGIS